MLGKNIRAARIKRGMTIKELAGHAQVKPHVIRDMENRGSLPRHTDIAALIASIAQAANTTISFLITGKTTQNAVAAQECERIVTSANKILKSIE